MISYYTVSRKKSTDCSKEFEIYADNYFESDSIHYRRKEESDMRIEAYTQVQQIYKTQKTSRSASVGATGSTKDQLQISDRGRDIQTAKAAVAAAPDIREDLTASIKEQVQSGNYSVDNSSFAAKLLEKYNALV